MEATSCLDKRIRTKSAAGILTLLLACPIARATERPARDFDNHPVLQASDLSSRDEESRISILIETGKTTPGIKLLELRNKRLIELSIVSGNAEFFYSEDLDKPPKRLRAVSYEGSTVSLPRLFAGQEIFRESLLEVRLDGTRYGSPLRVATIDEGVIPFLWSRASALRPAILAIDGDQEYVIFDPREVAHELLESDIAVISEALMERRLDATGLDPSQGRCIRDFASELPPELSPNPAWIDEEGDYRCPALIWYRPETSDPPFRINTCFSNLKTFGSAEFVGINPPAGFSLKPESGSTLFVPDTWIVNLVDGLYRHSWGCGVALKIPNNVVARIFATDASCCAGILATAAGKTCTWLDTTEHGDWPDCPL